MHEAANILDIHDVPNIWHTPLLLQFGCNQNAHEVKSLLDPCEDDSVSLGDDSMQRNENSEADIVSEVLIEGNQRI
ncbi:hypothetical protein L6452_40723 [Arctium lappa]|uniref:Uncharacterized protein n=1 Tax=Arctium lappa TaxID=4217 RepID=A0ACB8XMP6_ARCLA|nr:hypothetical protein L6452_40723 [Arctium lappa]